MLEFIVKYWIQFLFASIITVVSLLYKKIKAYYISLDATKNGLKVLLKDEIVKRYIDYSNNGCVDIYDQETLYDMYQQYKKLGGNGIADEMVEKIEDLPLKDRCEVKL